MKPCSSKRVQCNSCTQHECMHHVHACYQIRNTILGHATQIGNLNMHAHTHTHTHACMLLSPLACMLACKCMQASMHASACKQCMHACPPHACMQASRHALQACMQACKGACMHAHHMHACMQGACMLACMHAHHMHVCMHACSPPLLHAPPSPCSPSASMHASASMQASMHACMHACTSHACMHMHVHGAKMTPFH